MAGDIHRGAFRRRNVLAAIDDEAAEKRKVRKPALALAGIDPDIGVSPATGQMELAGREPGNIVRHHHREGLLATPL